ncbi:MAG: hypothetical protein A2314_05170 [Elusimicrobia bacterium RIFOXYB2_FULL_50_12]|nr:MAG: hypothetical protein A2314_05170 [Elusimicrobia bacterium RIFOXYB2_FULL_50_12]
MPVEKLTLLVYGKKLYIRLLLEFAYWLLCTVLPVIPAYLAAIHIGENIKLNMLSAKKTAMFVFALALGWPVLANAMPDTLAAWQDPNTVLDLISQFTFSGLAALAAAMMAAGGNKTGANLPPEVRERRKIIDMHAMRKHDLVIVPKFKKAVGNANIGRKNKIEIGRFSETFGLYMRTLWDAIDGFDTPAGRESVEKLDNLSQDVILALNELRGQFSADDTNLSGMADDIHGIMSDGRELSVIGCDVLEQVLNKVKNRWFTLEFDWHDKKSVMMGNRLLFERIFENLKRNSYDAFSEKELSLLRQGIPAEDILKNYKWAITVRVTDDRNDWIIVYSDTGPGIRGELLENNRLFEPGVSSRGGGLSGYGLAICKEMVEAMNGTISVESEEGKGATFTIRLPKISPSTPKLVQLVKPDTKAEMFDLFDEIAGAFGEHDMEKIFYEEDYFSIFDKQLGSSIIQDKCNRLMSLLNGMGQDWCVIHNTNREAAQNIRTNGIRHSFGKLWGVVYDFKIPPSINERLIDVVRMVMVGSNKYGQVNKWDIIAQIIDSKDRYLQAHENMSSLVRDMQKNGEHVVADNYTDPVVPLFEVDLSLSYETEKLIDSFISEYLEKHNLYGGNLIRRGMAAKHLEKAAVISLWIDRLCSGVENNKSNAASLPAADTADYAVALGRNRMYAQSDMVEIAAQMKKHGASARAIAAKLSEAMKINLETLFNEGRAQLARERGVLPDDIEAGFVLAGSFARGDCALYSDVEFSVVGDGKREIEEYMKKLLYSMGYKIVDTYYYALYAPGAYINAYWYGDGAIVAGARDMYADAIYGGSFFREHKERTLDYLERSEFDEPVEMMRLVQFFADLLKIKLGIYDKINIFEILDEIEFSGILPQNDVRQIERFYANMVAMRLSGKERLDGNEPEMKEYAAVSSIISKTLEHLKQESNTPAHGAGVAEISYILKRADARRMVCGTMAGSVVERLFANMASAANMRAAGFFEENAAETDDIFDNQAVAPDVRSVIGGAAVRMAREGSLMRRRPLVYETIDISQVPVTAAMLRDYIDAHRALGVDTFVFSADAVARRIIDIISALRKAYAVEAAKGALPMPAIHADYRVENDSTDGRIKQQALELVKAGASGIRFDLSTVDSPVAAENFVRSFDELAAALTNENADMVIAVIPPVAAQCGAIIEPLVTGNSTARRVMRYLPGRQPKNVPAGAYVEICLDEYAREGDVVVRREYEFEALNEEAFKEEIRSLLQNPEAAAVGLSAGVFAGASQAGLAAPGAEKFDIAEFFAGLVRERRSRFMQTPEGMYAHGRGMAMSLAEGDIPDIDAFRSQWVELVRAYEGNNETQNLIEQAGRLAARIDGRKYPAAAYFMNRRIRQAAGCADPAQLKLYAASLAGFMEGILEAGAAFAARETIMNSIIVPELITALRGSG